MVRQVVSSNLCQLSAEEFWGLRMDTGFDQFMADARGGGCQVMELEEGEDEAGKATVHRITLLTYQENPIPQSLRKFVCEDFSFKVKAQWHRDLCDEQHGMTFKSEPPVFADKIKVGGKQWVEPISATQCRIRQQTEITVSIFGVGGQVEKALEAQIQDSCAGLPSSAEAYVAYRREKARAAARAAAPAPAAAPARVAADMPETADAAVIATGDGASLAAPGGGAQRAPDATSCSKASLQSEVAQPITEPPASEALAAPEPAGDAAAAPPPRPPAAAPAAAASGADPSERPRAATDGAASSRTRPLATPPPTLPLSAQPLPEASDGPSTDSSPRWPTALGEARAQCERLRGMADDAEREHAARRATVDEAERAVASARAELADASKAAETAELHLRILTQLLAEDAKAAAVDPFAEKRQLALRSRHASLAPAATEAAEALVSVSAAEALLHGAVGAREAARTAQAAQEVATRAALEAARAAEENVRAVQELAQKARQAAKARANAEVEGEEAAAAAAAGSHGGGGSPTAASGRHSRHPSHGRPNGLRSTEPAANGAAAAAAVDMSAVFQRILEQKEAAERQLPATGRWRFALRDLPAPGGAPPVAVK